MRDFLSVLALATTMPIEPLTPEERAKRREARDARIAEESAANVAVAQERAHKARAKEMGLTWKAYKKRGLHKEEVTDGTA